MTGKLGMEQDQRREGQGRKFHTREANGEYSEKLLLRQENGGQTINSTNQYVQ